MGDEEDQAEYDTLVCKFSSGDWDALEKLLNRCSDRLLGHIRVRVRCFAGARLDPDDILQATWLKAFQKSHLFQPDQAGAFKTAAFFSWLRTIANNIITDRVRKESRNPQGVLFPQEGHPANDRTPSSLVARQENTQRMIEAIDQLPTEVRDVVRLHNQGKKQTEIAEILGWTRSRVWRLLHLAPQQLRQLMGATSSWFGRGN